MHIQKFGPVGQREEFNLSRPTGTFNLTHMDHCRLFHVKDDRWVPFELNQPVNALTLYDGRMSVISSNTGSQMAELTHNAENGQDPDIIRITYTAPHLGLSVDADRDGIVRDAEEGKGNWVWGAGQRGSILLVNNDRDLTDFDPDGKHISELAQLLVLDPGIEYIPTGFSIRLFCTRQAAERFSVYRVADGQPEIILGRTRSGRTLSVSPPLNPVRQKLYVEGHQFPGPNFEGLITIELQLVREVPAGSVVLATDRVVLRVAPWIMTPNHLPAKVVYTCDMSETGYPNPKFLSDLRTALDEIGIPLHVVPPDVNGGDRWIQDEIEFGYSMGPGHALPVVFDSPRDRELDGFPEASLLGPDFGHFQIGGSGPNSLDAFGNLEVSPPVTVNGKAYPLGRIIFGGREYGNYSVETRQMMPEIRRFLYAQKVQSPVEIYTDWLAVGHVDEIVCFVPAHNESGFQMLLAWPDTAHTILKRLSANGHDDVVMFQGRYRLNGAHAERSVGDLLADWRFWKANEIYQQYQNRNREILKNALGLADGDILEVPVLFYPPSTQRTLAYFPDMVNQLVLGEYSLVPKPYGPIIDGVDQFEKAFQDAVPSRKVKFVEDWYSYHELSGEVHCGTNCLREPPAVNWWEYMPDGGYDV